MPATEVNGAYHDLWQVEQSFRMSKTGLRARPMFLHTRDGECLNNGGPDTPGVAWRGGLIMSDTMDAMATDVDQQELAQQLPGPGQGAGH